MRKRHNSASEWEPLVGFSRAIRVGDRIIVSGTAPIGPDGKSVEGDVYAQASRCFAVIVEAIEALGGTAADVVRTRMYLTGREHVEGVGRAHREWMGIARPAATQVIVAGLNAPEWVVEIEAEAVIDTDRS